MDEDRKQQGLPVVGMDFAFMDQEEEPDKKTTIVEDPQYISPRRGNEEHQQLDRQKDQ